MHRVELRSYWCHLPAQSTTFYGFENAADEFRRVQSILDLNRVSSARSEFKDGVGGEGEWKTEETGKRCGLSCLLS